MPSRDKINSKANEWMREEGLVHQGASSATPKKKPERVMAAQVERIARRLGRNPDDLAKELPADTIRRLQYPVLEHRNPDGTRSFEHDIGISDGARSTARQG